MASQGCCSLRHLVHGMSEGIPLKKRQSNTLFGYVNDQTDINNKLSTIKSFSVQHTVVQ